MDGRDQQSIIEEIDIEQLIEESIPYSDPLTNYSARDLITALTWTDKRDLVEAIPYLDDNSIDELCEALTQAVRGLRKFYPEEIANLIESCEVVKKSKH